MRIVFMGTPEFALPALRALIGKHELVLVVTQPDKPAGRKKRLMPPPVKLLAEEAGIPVIQPSSARTPEFLQRMQDANADVAVVVAYGKLLPTSVLESFTHGCINIHGSLLPKYRGAAPIQWAVINDDAETGVSIMRLDEGMDTGPVLLSKRETIGPGDSAGSLFERLADLGATAICEALEGIQNGSLEAKAQPSEGASHAPMLQKSDGLIDWSQEAKKIAAQIRGMDPWPGAYTPYAEGNLKIFGAQACEGEGEPGVILGYNKSGMRVACGRGACLIREVQAPGKKRMGADVFARGRRLEAGATLFRPVLESES